MLLAQELCLIAPQTSRRNLVKTRILLSAFERQQRVVSYYALDISEGELSKGLHQLIEIFGQSTYVQVRGLLGSYEDGMQWLAGISCPTQVVTILWLGNSMANYSREDAAALLKGFVRSCDSRGLSCRFLLGLDSCHDLAKITASYDFYPGSPSEDLIVNGLRAANACLGQEVFCLRDWTARASYDLREHTLGLYYVATRDQNLVLGGYSREFRAGDRLLAITSGKWLIEDIEEISCAAGLQVSQSWWSDAQDYGKSVSASNDDRANRGMMGAFHAIQPQL